MPWYSREINFANGQESVCCWLSKDISRLELQRKFLSGQSVPECNKCWQSEEQGIESRREMENRFLDFKMSKDIDLIKSDAVQGTAQQNMYQIFLGSTCNGTCVTCGPRASSSWRSLVGNTVSIRQENHEVQQHFLQFAKSINWTQAKRFNLLGGEPLLIPRSFDILRNLLDAGNTDCRISFVTNGSVTLSKSQIELIKSFSDTNVCVSIDGIGPVFEYLRYPLSWQRLEHNLSRYREIFGEITVSFTVSNLNYHVREECIKWFEYMGLLYIENYVTFPEWFDHRVGPGHQLWPKFRQEIQKQDQLKGICISDYMPEIHEMLQQHA